MTPPEACGLQSVNRRGGHVLLLDTTPMKANAAVQPWFRSSRPICKAHRGPIERNRAATGAFAKPKAINEKGAWPSRRRKTV
jgi:hypothetical protein